MIPLAFIFPACSDLVSMHLQDVFFFCKKKTLNAWSFMCWDPFYLTLTGFKGWLVHLCLSTHLLVRVRAWPSKKKGWEGSCCFSEVTGREGADMLCFFFFFKRNELQQKSSRKFESLTQSSFGVEGGNTCAASLVKESGASYSHLHIWALSNSLLALPLCSWLCFLVCEELCPFGC